MFAAVPYTSQLSTIPRVLHSEKPQEGLSFTLLYWISVADPGGGEGAMAPPGPVKIGHKKDGPQRRPHRFHVSRPPLTRPLDPLLDLSSLIVSLLTGNYKISIATGSYYTVNSAKHFVQFCVKDFVKHRLQTIFRLRVSFHDVVRQKLNHGIATTESETLFTIVAMVT